MKHATCYMFLAPFTVLLSLQTLCLFSRGVLSHVGLPAELDQEMWLKEAVLAVFPDSRDCPPSLVRFTRMADKG